MSAYKTFIFLKSLPLYRLLLLFKSKLTSQLISCENKMTHVTHLSLRPHAGLQGHICYQQWQGQYPGGRSCAAHVSKLWPIWRFSAATPPRKVLSHALMPSSCQWIGMLTCIWTFVEHLILRWALCTSHWQLNGAILCFRADSLHSSHTSTHTRMHARTHTHMHTYMHTHTPSHTYSHAHTHSLVVWRHTL